ncbi:MAG TPA: type II toxin-antitoxin system prevent-host-death family antitoxin [Longimicrobiales bacterium]|nr:type II toxin-antitoxin system prevent-host-death family antitoxin [Longimicrobiales bacterium]
MTISGQIMVMNRRIGVADLKAHLSQLLRYVRSGHTLTVLDRRTPVARIVPLEGDGLLAARPPMGRVARLADVPLPPPASLPLDAVGLLVEERDRERSG